MGFLEEWGGCAACSRGDSGTLKRRRAGSSGLTGADLSGDKSGHRSPGRETGRGKNREEKSTIPPENSLAHESKTTQAARKNRAAVAFRGILAHFPLHSLC